MMEHPRLSDCDKPYQPRIYMSIVSSLGFDSDSIRFETINGETFEYFDRINDLSCYGYVYLLQCEQYYKIGMTKDVVKRTISNQTGNPFEVKIIDTFLSLDKNADEKILHRLMGKYWHRGEWFEIPKSMIAKKSNWFKSYFLPSDIAKDVVETNKYYHFADQHTYQYGDIDSCDLLCQTGDDAFVEMRRKYFLAQSLLANIKLISAFNATGLVTESWQYGTLTNATYTGLLGADAKTLKVQMGLKPDQLIRDNLDEISLIAIQLSELVASEKAANATSFDHLKSITYQQAHKIRMAIA